MKPEPRRYDSVQELRDAHQGHFCEKRCPKCGATLLRNKLGDEWCSFIHCDFGIEDRRGKPASPALDRLKEEIASGPHHLMCTSRMRGHNCNCWRFRALRIIEELK